MSVVQFPSAYKKGLPMPDHMEKATHLISEGGVLKVDRVVMGGENMVRLATFDGETMMSQMYFDAEQIRQLTAHLLTLNFAQFEGGPDAV